MIPIAYVNRYNTWESARNNERDLILNWAIVRLFQDMSGRLAIRGGTALYKLLVRPAPRFSEDIDLILTRDDNIEEVSEIIQEIFNPCLGSPRVKPSEIKTGTLIRSLTYTPENLRIKIEINIRDRFTELGFLDMEFESPVNWIDGVWIDSKEKAVAKTYCLNEMMATKLHMIYEPDRKKGRDLFDLWYVMEHLKDADTDMDAVLSCFQAHMKNRGIEITREEFVTVLEKKSDEPDFKENINLLLRENSSIPWNFDVALAYVREHMIARI